MKNLGKLLVAGLLTCSLVGCGETTNQDAEKPKEPKYDRVEGVPLSVYADGGGMGEPEVFSTTVKTKEGKYITGYDILGGTLEYAKAFTKVDAEIRDGDNDSIILKGKFDKEGNLNLDHLWAHGKKINFHPN